MAHSRNDFCDRQAVVAALRALSDKNLNRGTAGNVSVRSGRGMLITPTGIAPERLEAGQIVHLSLDGTLETGQLAPSSEWRLHAAVYQAGPSVNAVVHCHSPYATIMACARKAIPAMHYMVAGAGGHGIPLADYATFGSEALSRASLTALSGHRACLLANHGQLATGGDLASALALAELVEEQAHCYWGTLAIGGPVLLAATEMNEVLDAFRHYGQQGGGGSVAGEKPEHGD